MGGGIRAIDAKEEVLGREGKSAEVVEVDRKAEVFIKSRPVTIDGPGSSYQAGRSQGMMDFLAIGDRGGTPDVRVAEQVRRYESAEARALPPAEIDKAPAELPPPKITGIESLIKNLAYYFKKAVTFLLGGMGGGMAGPMMIFPVWLLKGKAEAHASGPRLEVMESDLQEALKKNPRKGSTVEIWLEKVPPPDATIAHLKAEAQQRGIRFELKDVDHDRTIHIEVDKEGKTRAWTTDPEMALANPTAVTLVLELPDSSQVSQKISALAEMGFKQVIIHITAENPPPAKLADSARIAVENGMSLDLNSGKSHNLSVRVAQEKGGAQIKLNAGELTGPGAPPPEVLGKLTRSALQAHCQSLQIGKGILISKNFQVGRQVYNFSTNFSLAKVDGVFSEYLAFETLASLRLKPGEIGNFQRYWQGALQHAVDMERFSNPKEPAKKAEYSPYTQGAHWVLHWQHSLTAMQRFAQHPSNRARLEKTFQLLQKYSQAGTGNFLGFKPFDGRALADNAFELMRLMEVGQNNPQLRLDLILDRLATVLGPQGNLEMYGAVVGTVFKSSIPKAGSDGRAVYDFAAQNELIRLLEMKSDLKMLGGRYRISVIPEDRMQGSNFGTPEFTKTPEWVVETLGPDGKPLKALTVEVTQADGAKVSDSQINTTIGKKVDQLTGHQFGKGAPVQQSLIAYKFYNASGSESSLIETTRRAVQAKLGNFPSPEMKNLRIAVVFEYKVRGESSYRMSTIEFSNGHWIVSNSAKYLPADWYPTPKRQAVGGN